MITRTFKLCLNAGTGSAPYINVSQYDEGETWLFELYSETGERYIPTTGAIVGVKSDGHGIVNTGTVDNEGRVVITETQQMTASAGRAIFELSIDGLTHGTANFIVAVERKPTDEAVMSDSDLSLIQEAIDSAEVIVEVIGDGDPSEVIGEHVDDWLDNHPEATTTVQDGAITAPKINNSLWDKLLVSEEASGAVASFEDGADDIPVSSLKVALEPVQLGSGDPSPSNIRPIYPANGKNLFPTAADGTYTNSGVTVVANNGVYTVTGTGTATSYIELSLATSVDLSPATNQFAFLNSVTDGNIEFAVYRDSTRVHYWAMSPQNRVTKNWTDTGNEVVNKIRFNFQSGKTYNITISPVLCLSTYPTPTAFTPYQGISVLRTGKNFLPSHAVESTTTNGVTFTANANGTITVNGTATAEAQYAITFSNLTGNYYFSGCPSGGSNTTYEMFAWDYTASARFKKWNGTTASDSDFGTGGKEINIPSGHNGAVSIRIRNGYTANNLVFKPMIRLASETDATYEPYTGNTYPYTLGQSVYGGTVDLATGVLTVTHGYVDMGSLTWTLNAQYNNLWTSNTGVQSKLTALLLSDTPFNDITLNNTQLGSHSNAPYNVWVRNGSTTIQPSGIGVYELATPTTVQLTPQEVKTLLGYNNISSSGTVDVIYHADTKLYVDKMTAVDNNIIAPTEADFVATRNYTTNDLVIVNDTLYKVTANIATGSAITPNSNVQQTTLGALIKALS